MCIDTTAQTLAYPDPWEKFLDFRRVVAYAAEYPSAGRVCVGNALDLLNQRVRGWLKETVLDLVRAINTAIEHGWLDPDSDNETAVTLVELLAHVLAGESITARNYAPAVTPGERVAAAEICLASSVSVLRRSVKLVGTRSRCSLRVTRR